MGCHVYGAYPFDPYRLGNQGRVGATGATGTRTFIESFFGGTMICELVVDREEVNTASSKLGTDPGVGKSLGAAKGDSRCVTSWERRSAKGVERDTGK